MLGGTRERNMAADEGRGGDCSQESIGSNGEIVGRLEKVPEVLGGTGKEYGRS